jgi:uncharacterized membrane protein YbhN (UPF0104 family)
MKPETSKLHLNRRYLLVMALLVLSLYVLVPQFGSFHSSWHILRHPMAGWTIAAIGLTAATYAASALTYCLLALRPLKYGQTALVQLAAMFINRLLPGGIGALGTNYAYLRRKRHSNVQAASVVAINNLLGALGHVIIVAFALLFMMRPTTYVPDYGHNSGIWLRGFIVLAISLGILALALGRQKLKSRLSELRRQLLIYNRRRWHVLAALLSSIVLTLANVLCLMSCALALGVHLSFTVNLLVFTFGIGAGTATPTPGGLGGFEAGLAAGFIAYHVASPVALAAALLYRLVSYWLPLGFGAVAFIVCQRRKLLY